MSRSRTARFSSPSVGSPTPNVAKELEELRTATRLAHEVLRDLKEERKGVQEDRKQLELTKTLLEAAVKDTKDFIEKEVMVTMSQVLANNLSAGKTIIDDVIKELGDMMLEFREGRDILLGRSIKHLEEAKMHDKAKALQDLMRRKSGKQFEIVVLDLDEDDNPTISTFGNGD